MVLLPELYGEVTRRRLLRLRVGALSWCDKENGIRVAAEIVAHDMEGRFGVSEGLRDLCGGTPFDEISAERLILTLFGGCWLEEEAADIANIFWCSYRHINTVSRYESYVN